MIKLFAVVLLLTAPALVLAGPAHYYDEPDTTYATNVVIDIIEHAGGVWFATGEGVNFSFDNGQTWLLYNKDNGLVSSDVSAIYSDGSRLWVATNHMGSVAGSEESFSDGLAFTDNNGTTWTQADFGTLPYVTGPFRTVYDITGAKGFHGQDLVFASAFAGGLFGSADRGATWQRVFINAQDSISFYRAYLPANQKLDSDTLLYRQRYFSCAADTSHGDSLFLWVGTAGGVLQYVLTQPKDRFYTYGIQKIAYCQSCRGKSADSLYMFIGGKNGVTRSIASGGLFLTRFTGDGLPGPMVTALYESGDESASALFVGTADSTGNNSRGLAISTDYGETYVASPDTAFLGPNHQIRDFTSVHRRVYMAAQEAGLRTPCQICPDTLLGGWNRIYVDTSSQSPSDGWNTVWSVTSLGDTLFVGTDSGLAIMFMSPLGVIDSTRLARLPNNATASSRVMQVRLQTFGLDTLTGVADSFHIWTVLGSTTTGTPAVGRSLDRGVTWEYYQSGIESEQLQAVGDTVFVVDTAGVKYADATLDTVRFNKIVIRQGSDSLVDVTAVSASRRLVAFGADRGLALSQDAGRTYHIFRPNFNALSPNLVTLYTDSTTLNLDTNGIYQMGLTGNFIPAIAVRYLPGKPAQVLASCRPTQSGVEGMSIGTEGPLVITRIDTTNTGDTVITQDTIGYGYRWAPMSTTHFAWNFDSHGPDTVYAATDAGLEVFTGAGTDQQTVDTIEFKNAQGIPLLTPGTSVFAVRQIDTSLWAGTDDGTVRINLKDLSDQSLFIRTDSSEDIYAYPVPFSPNRGNEQVRFHFPVNVAGNVSLQIYDFAMNLVATPVNSRYFPVGVYPPGPLEGERISWNGVNDKGDVAAVGVYYIKITYGDGSIKWGKLAIVP